MSRSRVPTTGEVIRALLCSEELHAVAELLPMHGEVGRPRELPGWSVFLVGCLARHYRSAARATSELASEFVWHQVLKAVDEARGRGIDVPGAPRPPSWHAWRRARDQYLATEEGLATIGEIHLEHAVRLAHSLGLGSVEGGGSWSHPVRTRAVYGDGTLVRPLYKPPTAVRVDDGDGGQMVLYPDPETGELLTAPKRRFDPDSAEHHGHTGPVHGTNYVSWHLRGPHYYQRVILAVARVPGPGQEAESAVRLLADVHRAFGDGIQVAVYDGAMRGVHIEAIMRTYGYLVLAKPTRDQVTDQTPSLVRLDSGKAARSVPLGVWEHDTPSGMCRHTLAAIDGAPAEVGLDEAGDPVLLGQLPRRQVKRPRLKDGRYRFSVGYEVACPHEPFWVWLSPHPEKGDRSASRPENLRVIAAGDPDGMRLRGIRSDVEAHHDAFKQTLRNWRAASLGANRGLLDQYAFAVMHNALVASRAEAGAYSDIRAGGRRARR